MRIRAWTAWTAFAVVAVAGCSNAPERTSSPADSRAVRACHVTHPGGDLPAEARGLNYGNRSLAVALWRRGRLVAGRLPDGGRLADINPDGSISAKLGWWRGVEGRLRVTGRR